MTGFMCFQGVNIDAWNNTPEKVRQALPRAQTEAIAAMIQAYEKADKYWIPIFKEHLEIVKIAPSELTKLQNVSGKIWDEWASDQTEKGRPGVEILEFVKATVEKHMN